jgi:hypothetical protein
MGVTGAVLRTARRCGKDFDVNACDSHSGSTLLLFICMSSYNRCDYSDVSHGLSTMKHGENGKIRKFL